MSRESYFFAIPFFLLYPEYAFAPFFDKKIKYKSQIINHKTYLTYLYI